MASWFREVGAPFGRVRAILVELKFHVQIRAGKRRECQALTRLGAAVASADLQERGEIGALASQISNRRVELDQLRAAIRASLDQDRADFITISRWMRPVVVLRGVCSRAVLRHQLALSRRSLVAPHQTLGEAVFRRGTGRGDLPQGLFRAVREARASLQAAMDQRSRSLAPYGGSALPKWFPGLQQESKVLGRSFWAQLRPHILPRSPALVGLAVGWWLANTYTDSQVQSVLRSLGIGHGGRRVVSSDTYEAMMFWMPVVSAAVCAYLVDRTQLLIHQRYSRAAPESKESGTTLDVTRRTL